MVPDSILELEDILNSMDKAKDGLLDKTVLKHALNVMFPFNDDELVCLLSIFDTRTYGGISIREFVDRLGENIGREEGKK